MVLLKWIRVLEANSQSVVRFGTIVPLVLQIFSRPGWTYNPAVEDTWDNVSLNPSFDVSLIQCPTLAVCELMCNLIVILGLWMQMWPISATKSNIYKFYTRDEGLKKRMVVVKIAILLLLVTILQTIVNLAYFAIHNKPAINLSPIEVVIFILLEPALYGSMSYCIRRVTNHFLGLIIVLLCIILTWAVLALLLMDQGENPNHNYGNLVGSYWSTLMVMNAADWPNPIIPSYEINSAYFFYFLSFVILIEWGYLNLILAIIISSVDQSIGLSKQRIQREKGLKSLDLEDVLLARQREAMSNVVNPMYENDSAPENCMTDELSTFARALSWWKRMFNLLADFSMTERGLHATNAVRIILGFQFRLSPDPSASLIFILTFIPFILITSKMGLLRQRQRQRASKFEMKMKRNLELDNVNEAASNTGSTIEDTHAETRDDARDSEGQEKDCCGEIEPIKNMFGWYMGSNVHILMYIAFFLASMSFYGRCVEGPQEPSDDDSESQGCSYSILTHNLYSTNSKAIIFTVVVIRVYIVITLLNLPFFSSVWYLLPTRWRLRIERAWLIFREAEGHFLHLFLFIFVVTYFFAAIGCRIWGGGITFDVESPYYDASLYNSEYATLNYWPLNFNDMIGAMFTLYTLLYVNNMNITVSGFTSITSNWALLYFISWYVIGPLFFMNILTTLVYFRIGRLLDPNVMPLPEYLSSNETKEREHCVDTSYVQRGDLDEDPSCKREGVASPLHDLEDERKEDNVVGGEESENGSNTSEPSALESVEMADVSAAEKGNKTETFERLSNNRRSKKESFFSKRKSTNVLQNTSRQPSTFRSTQRSVEKESFAESLLRASAKFDEGFFSDLVRDRSFVLNGTASPLAMDGQSNEGIDSDSEIKQRWMSRSFDITNLRNSYEEQKAVELRIYSRSKVDNNLNAGIFGQARQSSLWELSESESASKRTQKMMKSMHQFIGARYLSYIERAGVLVQFARKAEVHTMFSTSTALKYFQMRYRLTYYLLGASWSLIFLSCFAEPPWLVHANTFGEEPTGCNRDGLITACEGDFYLSPAMLIAVKAPLLILIGSGLVLEILYKADNDYSLCNLCRRGPSYVIRMILLLIVLLNLIFSFLEIHARSQNWDAAYTFTCFTWYLSVPSIVNIVWFDRYALRKFILVIGVFPKLTLFLTFLFGFILVCCGNAMFIFDLTGIPSGEDAMNQPWDDDYSLEYYSSYTEGVWSSIGLITSSNYPTPIMAVLENNRSFVVFVLFFITIGSFFILDAGFATVNFAFQQGLKKKEMYEVKLKRGLMKASFRILCEISHRLYPDIIEDKKEEDTSEHYNHRKQLNTNISREDLPAREHSNLRDSLVIAGCVANAVLDDLFTNYADWKKLSSLTKAKKELLVNLMDVDGDGVISIRDYEHMVLECRVNMIVDSEDEKTTKKNMKPSAIAKKEQNQHNRKDPNEDKSLPTRLEETLRMWRKRLKVFRRTFSFFLYRLCSRPKKQNELPNRVIVLGGSEIRVPFLHTIFWNMSSDAIEGLLSILTVPYYACE